MNRNVKGYIKTLEVSPRYNLTRPFKIVDDYSPW